MNNSSNAADEAVYYVTKVTCIFWLIAKLLTWKLWLANRSFPLAPLFNSLSYMPDVVHFLLLFASLTCLFALLFQPDWRVLMAVLLMAEIVSCICDQNRWQPWEYQYIFVIVTVFICRNKTAFALSAVGFILAATYFYSGINKLNTGFLNGVWSNTILIRFFKLPTHLARYGAMHKLGYAAGMIEAAAGIALLYNKTRKTAASLLIVMHLFNLILLGPLGLQYNVSVWPWNIAMILYLTRLFLSPVHLSYGSLLAAQNLPVVFFWGLLPALNFFGKWDDYLSSNLYSGKTKQMVVCFKGNNNDYPKELDSFLLKKDTKHICSDGRILSVMQWSMAELHVPCYPEVRVFVLIKESLLKKYPGHDAGFFIVTQTSTSPVAF